MDFETNDLLHVDAQPLAFQMRCPNCRKLYSVEPHLLGASPDEFSKFECVGCHTTFLATRPELHGHQFLETQMLETQLAPLNEVERVSEVPRDEAPRAALIAVPVRARECPNCHSANTLAARECIACGVVFARFRPGAEARAADDMSLAESAELIAMWDAITDDYEDISKHESFVQRCFELEKLAFAAHKYAQVLVSAPHEDIARRMRRRAAGLASFGFDATAQGLNRSSWRFPLPSFNNLIIMFGAIAVVVGLGLPHVRQAAGVGFAMIALAIGLRIFLRKPST